MLPHKSPVKSTGDGFGDTLAPLDQEDHLPAILHAAVNAAGQHSEQHSTALTGNVSVPKLNLQRALAVTGAIPGVAKEAVDSSPSGGDSSGAVSKLQQEVHQQLLPGALSHRRGGNANARPPAPSHNSVAAAPRRGPLASSSAVIVTGSASNSLRRPLAGQDASLGLANNLGVGAPPSAAGKL
jgi:hypothetical protein